MVGLFLMPIFPFRLLHNSLLSFCLPRQGLDIEVLSIQIPSTKLVELLASSIWRAFSAAAGKSLALCVSTHMFPHLGGPLLTAGVFYTTPRATPVPPRLDRSGRWSQPAYARGPAGPCAGRVCASTG